MNKPKYCSWDVRDLASDYNWLELSDQRDISNLRFEIDQLVDCTVKVNFTLSINLSSGFVTVHSEKDNLIYSHFCSDFGEIEKLFNISQNHALIEKVKNSRNSSSEQSKDNFSRNPSNKVLVKDNPDQFSKLQSILQNWDSEEAI